VSTMVICSGEGASAETDSGTGLAAARTGRRKAAILTCMFAFVDTKTVGSGEALK
jgi:hypothetical protein